MAHSVELHFLYLAIPVVYIRFSQMAKGAPVMQLYYCSQIQTFTVCYRLR